MKIRSNVKGGWYGESYRHYLSSKGICTGRTYRAPADYKYLREAEARRARGVDPEIKKQIEESRKKLMAEGRLIELSPEEGSKEAEDLLARVFGSLPKTRERALKLETYGEAEREGPKGKLGLEIYDVEQAPALQGEIVTPEEKKRMDDKRFNRAAVQEEIDRRMEELGRQLDAAEEARRREQEPRVEFVQPALTPEAFAQIEELQRQRFAHEEELRQRPVVPPDFRTELAEQRRINILRRLM